MKKIISTILLSCLCLANFGQEAPQIKIKFSEIYATYSFVQQLTKYYPDSEYKKAFKNSEYNNDKYNKLIAQIDTLNLYVSADFQGYPAGQKLPLMTNNIINKNLISSKNLLEFRNKMFGIIPSSELQALNNIIESFIPVYKALIYTPNKKQFDEKVQDLKHFAKKEGFDKYFNVGLKFYNSKWDNSIVFDIVVIPSLNKNGFTATAFMNNAVSEIQIDFEQYDILFSVLMHEIFHIQYDEESLKVKTDIDQWFKNNASKNSQYAYLLLNEVLATALGNGYVYEQLNNELDPYDWYNNKYINLMAKKIYPTVMEYIEEQKPIDEEFVNIYISLYDEHFSTWVNELDNILTYRYILSFDQNDFNYFFTNYPYASFSFMEDVIDVVSISKMKEAPITKVVVISKKNLSTLKLLTEHITELSAWNYDAEIDFVKTFDLDDKTKLFIVNSVNTSPEVLLNNTFPNKKIE